MPGQSGWLITRSKDLFSYMQASDTGKLPLLFTSHAFPVSLLVPPPLPVTLQAPKFLLLTPYFLSWRSHSLPTSCIPFLSFCLFFFFLSKAGFYCSQGYLRGAKIFPCILPFNLGCHSETDRKLEDIFFLHLYVVETLAESNYSRPVK